MPIARYLRVVTFSPEGHESSVDAALRDVCLPALLDHPCVVDAWIGRHGARFDQRRVIASTWTELPGDASPDVDVLGRLAASVGSPLSTEHIRVRGRVAGQLRPGRGDHAALVESGAA